MTGAEDEQAAAGWDVEYDGRRYLISFDEVLDRFGLTEVDLAPVDEP